MGDRQPTRRRRAAAAEPRSELGNTAADRQALCGHGRPHNTATATNDVEAERRAAAGHHRNTRCSWRSSIAREPEQGDRDPPIVFPTAATSDIAIRPSFSPAAAIYSVAAARARAQRACALRQQRQAASGGCGRCRGRKPAALPERLCVALACRSAGCAARLRGRACQLRADASTRRRPTLPDARGQADGQGTPRAPGKTDRREGAATALVVGGCFRGAGGRKLCS